MTTMWDRLKRALSDVEEVTMPSSEGGSLKLQVQRQGYASGPLMLKVTSTNEFEAGVGGKKFVPQFTYTEEEARWLAKELTRIFIAEDKP